MQLRLLKVPVAFCQLDEVGEIPATFAEMVMRVHIEDLGFILAPGMVRRLVIGLAWLWKWNPYVNWSRGLLKIQ